jgi:hypothetical protein
MGGQGGDEVKGVVAYFLVMRGCVAGGGGCE